MLDDFTTLSPMNVEIAARESMNFLFAILFLLVVSHNTHIIGHLVEKVKRVVGIILSYSYSSYPPIEFPAYICLVQNLDQVFHQLWRYVRVFAVNLGVQLKCEILM